MTPEAKIQRTRAWLRYAARDLRVARASLRPDAEAEPYHAAFWAQQAAEKALKAALVYADIPFEATHNLDALAARLPDGWTARQAAGLLGQLTGYGVETRYPDLGEPEPTAEDARRAVIQANAVQRAVRRDLEAHGFVFQTRATEQGRVERPAPRDEDTPEH